MESFDSCYGRKSRSLVWIIELLFLLSLSLRRNTTHRILIRRKSRASARPKIANLLSVWWRLSTWSNQCRLLCLFKTIPLSLSFVSPCRCKTCGEYIYKGKKFNARKEDVDNENYLGIRIYRFYIKVNFIGNQSTVICWNTTLFTTNSEDVAIFEANQSPYIATL